MSESADAGGGPETVDFDMSIADGRTEIRVAGDRDTAVIVRSASGEHIYLPPEDFERSAESGGGRQTPYESPYDPGSGVGDTPYRSSGSPQVTGLEPTADGYRIVHPEPVTDVRFLR
ncbi:hypothetical protein ACFQE8_07045 [Salinirubellus sp. GCM10025818]|uniref:DUF7510 family protein n=1 Tax=Salinirubellus TaxID=2162630 RepID=UPI0030D39354